MRESVTSGREEAVGPCIVVGGTIAVMDTFQVYTGRGTGVHFLTSYSKPSRNERCRAGHPTVHDGNPVGIYD